MKGHDLKLVRIESHRIQISNREITINKLQTVINSIF